MQRSSCADSIAQIKRLTEQVAQLQKIIQEDDMKQMMMDFASTTQAELEAERGELQVCDRAALALQRQLWYSIPTSDETFNGGDRARGAAQHAQGGVFAWRHAAVSTLIPS